MNIDKKGRKKVHRKVIHGTTPEERFQEIHGMTIEEWNEQQLKAKTGMTRGEQDERYKKQVKSTTPFDFIKERYGTVIEDDIKLETGIMIFVFENGKVRELWCENSDAAILFELGALQKNKHKEF